MLIKNKELEKIRELIDEKIQDSNKKSLNQINSLKYEMKELFSEHKKALSHIYHKLKSFECEKQKQHQEMSEQIKSIAHNNDLLKKTINSFKILENKASKKLLEDTSSELKERLLEIMKTCQNYRNLENSLKTTDVSISNMISDLNNELEKYKDISSKIKSADFELTGFAKKLSKENSEKLRLMHENERLKRLVSKERQKNKNF